MNDSRAAFARASVGDVARDSVAASATEWRGYESVNSGSGIFSPPFIADSWAKIPTHVQLAD